MKKYNQIIGRYGEKVAMGYLEQKGYKIINKNAQVSSLEIDIIAKIKEKIVFFEVKTRTNNTLGKAEDAINSKKINNLKKAMQIYIKREKINPEIVRFDFLAIDIDKLKKIAKIKHYKDIF